MIDAIDDIVRQLMVQKVLALDLQSNVDKASNSLGEISLADGRVVEAHVVHAIDPIITDNEFVVMIDRKNPPGKGKPALPGGFLDPTKHGVEHGVNGAVREAFEEVGLYLSGGVLVGERNFNRPHDIRICSWDMHNYGINNGDIFIVSTQAVLFYTPNLKELELNAGDDAMNARLVRIMSLTEDIVGIPDHYGMIMKAVKLEEWQLDLMSHRQSILEATKIWNTAADMLVNPETRLFDLVKFCAKNNKTIDFNVRIT